MPSLLMKGIFFLSIIISLASLAMNCAGVCKYCLLETTLVVSILREQNKMNENIYEYNQKDGDVSVIHLKHAS